jgi:flagellar export protein FliJ
MQRLLDYRRRLESQARDLYLGARARKVAAEDQLAEACQTRFNLTGRPCHTLEEMIQKEMAVARMQDQEREMRLVISVLANEEEVEKDKWLAAKRDADAIEKLKERDQEIWMKEQEKKEQDALDEWAVMRRAA